MRIFFIKAVVSGCTMSTHCWESLGSQSSQTMPHPLSSCQAGLLLCHGCKALIAKAGSNLRNRAKLTMQGTMSSSLVANLLLIRDNHRDERLRLEIFLRHVLYIFTCDLFDEIGVPVRIVQPQLKIFNLGQEIRDLAVGIEAQRKASGQIILRI